MKESIICFTTAYKLLLGTFTVHSQRMGEGGENCMKSFVTTKMTRLAEEMRQPVRQET
jgi:hypothetical protein